MARLPGRWGSVFWEGTGMDPDLKLLESVVERAADGGAAFADARITESDGTGILCQDGRADKIGQGRSRAGGGRVLVEGA